MCVCIAIYLTTLRQTVSLERKHTLAKVVFSLVASPSTELMLVQSTVQDGPASLEYAFTLHKFKQGLNCCRFYFGIKCYPSKYNKKSKWEQECERQRKRDREIRLLIETENRKEKREERAAVRFILFDIEQTGNLLARVYVYHEPPEHRVAFKECLI